jgi:hypothetical protein
LQDLISKKSSHKKKCWWSGSSNECLPSKCEALSSNSNAAKEKKKNEWNEERTVNGAPGEIIDGSERRFIEVAGMEVRFINFKE